MKTGTKLLLVLLILLLAACSPTATSETTTMTDSMADETMTNSNMNDAAMMDDHMADEEMTDNMDDGTKADEGMADADMADEDMAHGDMADESMADEGMADEGMADESMADEDMAHGDMADENMADESMGHEAMMGDQPVWQQITLTDVRTNETFTLADFAGKTVYVEPMATWCTNCRQQLGNVKEAIAQLGDDNVVFVGISVETNIDNATLAEYVTNTGFDWPFAVATPEMLQSLADQFGRTIANPPSTPHFIIAPDGTVGELVTGFETPEEIIGRLQG